MYFSKKNICLKFPRIYVKVTNIVSLIINHLHPLNLESLFEYFPVIMHLIYVHDEVIMDYDACSKVGIYQIQFGLR